MRKIVYFFIVLILFFGLSFCFNGFEGSKTGFKTKQVMVAADESLEIETQLTENIDEQLDKIDFSNIDKIISNFDEQQKSLFNHNSFLEVVKDLIEGKEIGNFENFFSYITSLIFKDIVQVLPYFLTIIFVAIIANIAGQMSSQKSDGIKKIISTCCFCVVGIIVVGIVSKLIALATTVIGSISNQSEIIFPILLTLITALGGTAVSASTGSVVGLFTSVVIKIFVVVLIPIFILNFVTIVIGNLCQSVKFEKQSKLFYSIFNWCVGLIFTIFVGFLGIKGLLSSGLDRISVKATKYAIKNYIPILGSYLSDSVSIILASTGIIKNAIGVPGLILMISTILSPIIKILILILMLKAVSAILEPMSDGKISNFLFNTSKVLNMLNVCIIAVGVMYLISVYVLLIISNLF